MEELKREGRLRKTKPRPGDLGLKPNLEGKKMKESEIMPRGGEKKSTWSCTQRLDPSSWGEGPLKPR